MSDRYFAFISYANAHREWVATLQENLERCLDHYARTVDPLVLRRIFLDQIDLQSGRTRIDQFQEAVEQSQRLILVVSPEALYSQWVRQEWQSFYTRRSGDIFPVLIASAKLPPFLDPIQHVNFTELKGPEAPEYKKRLQQLFGDLLGRSRRKPPPMPPGLEPLAADGRPGSSFTSDATRELSRKIESAYEERAKVLATGGDPKSLNEAIVALKRRLREGPELEAGDFLLEGRFKLLETVGQGGFATVWKAYDNQQRAVVAVKVLHSQYSKDRSRRERFFRGARQMAGLQHAGIATVFETECEDGGYYFFAMEFLAGGDFRRAVIAGLLSLEKRLQVVLAIGDALSFAHSRGVVHRDVKPANILLDLKGRPKLTDFDLVRAADTTGGTRSGMLGTFLYAAPESLLDGSLAAQPADVYGLGMTMVFALKGSDLQMDVLFETKSLVSSLPIGAPGQNAVLRAVERDVIWRWTSIEEFCSAFRTAELVPRMQAPSQWLDQPDPTNSSTETRSASRAPGTAKTASRKPPKHPKTADPKRHQLLPILFLTLLTFFLAWSSISNRLSDGLEASLGTPTARHTAVTPPKPSNIWPTQVPATPSDSPSDWLPVTCESAAAWAGIEMVHIPEGVFPLGEEEGAPSETIGSFWIGKHPITNDQYKNYLTDQRLGQESAVYLMDGRFNDPNQPVVGISWHDALAFANWAGMTLPTEKQWEAAARGTEGRKYPWGDDPPTLLHADFGKDSSSGRPDPVGSHPVGTGPFGAQDQAGGVWEWCLDDWGTRTERPVRGGAWNDKAGNLKSTARFRIHPDTKSQVLGFRVACSSDYANTRLQSDTPTGEDWTLTHTP